MKKLKLVSMIGVASLFLVACEFAEGVDHEFGTEAQGVFIEIDEDTMEGELSDIDDKANVELLEVHADTQREASVVTAIRAMLTTQDGVIVGNKESLKEYLKARETAMDMLGVDDDGDSFYTVPAFQFTEDN